MSAFQLGIDLAEFLSGLIDRAAVGRTRLRPVHRGAEFRLQFGYCEAGAETSDQCTARAESACRLVHGGRFSAVQMDE